MRKERDTQNRIIQLFQQQLGFTYLGNWDDRPDNGPVEEDYLRNYLQKRNYSASSISKAITELKKTAALSGNEDLYPVNKAVYSLLRYGVKVREDAGEKPVTVKLIDWAEPKNNDFYIAEEVTIRDEKTKRPDIVLYINGIAFATIELKRGGIPVSEAIRQNRDNQSHRFIRSFFSTIQIVLAGNDSQGLYYGTTKTDEKYFLKWKEDHYTYKPGVNILDQHVLQFCTKERLLDLMHNFIVFDAGIKKMCRPNQYFGIQEAKKYIARREGGIIWHTQGSGKSLTMVWLAKWIRENQKDARLLIITDRTELDEQIETVFKGVDEQIYRTKSGADLIEKLNDTKPWLIASLIHKFGVKDDAATREFIEDLKIPKDFVPKGNLFVFIDECHRTQSGDLHKAMKELLPEALFIGFTGTPLLKADKKKSIEIFGPYIHTYKFDEAVADGVVLDLLYEARDVDQHVLDQKGIDEWFEAVTKEMNDLPKAELKQQWGTMQKVLSTKSRLERIVYDIVKDFITKPRLKEKRGNAILVSRSIYEACRYYQIFQNSGFKKCAIITSFEPGANSIKGESTSDGETEKLEQYEIYQKMLNGKDRETFEKEVKKQFVDEPANMQLLIVVDKLLTGFDAPSCTYLYIDKQMQDHGLFQAICRVNRTEKEDKQYGYIVDYKDLFNNLNKSISDYTSGAFDKYDEKDISGLLKDRLQEAKERLEDALETLHQICEPIHPPKEIEQYLDYFVGDTEDAEALKKGEELRLTFYKATVELIRAYNNIAAELHLVGYNEKKTESLKQKVNDYAEMRNAVKIASRENIDLKQYEPQMRQLLDMYLTADPTRTLSNFGEATLLKIITELGIEKALEELPKALKGSKRAMAETLEANMRSVIIQEMPINPAYYEKMSVLLTELVHQRKTGAIDYEEFLKRVEEFARNLQTRTSSDSSYPEKINTDGRKTLYDQLDKDEELVIALESEILYVKKDNWVGKTVKEREVLNVVKKYVKPDKRAEEILELIKKQNEYQ